MTLAVLCRLFLCPAVPFFFLPTIPLPGTPLRAFRRRSSVGNAGRLCDNTRTPSMKPILLTAALSYLLGSIPFGYLLVRTFRGEDVRQTGSGNIGATNVARSSTVLGVVTLILDALKGAAAASIAKTLSLRMSNSSPYFTLGTQHARFAQTPWPVQQAFFLAGVAALFVILGHVFPVWLRFRGGKGVATGLGAFLVIAPKTVLLVIVVFLVIGIATRRVSLASLVAVALFPLLAWRLNDYHGLPVTLACMLAASALIIAKHHANIRRLLEGTEPRFQLGGA
jgi:acyl phosphate:glycerol-3-phosphate acyltransferase